MVRAFSLKSNQNSISGWDEISTFNNDGDCFYFLPKKKKTIATLMDGFCNFNEINLINLRLYESYLVTTACEEKSNEVLSKLPLFFLSQKF